MRAISKHTVRKALIGSIAAAWVAGAVLALSMRASAGDIAAPLNLGPGYATIAAQPAGAAQAGSAGPDGHGGQWGDSQFSDSEWVGTVISVPVQGFIGKWQIIVDSTTTRTIIVDANTRLDRFHRAPRLGMWVEVKGTLQADGSILASRLRPDDFEGGQVVVRLKEGTSDAALQQFADTYNLKLIDTLLASAEIYRFATGDDEEQETARLANDPLVLWAELNYTNGIPRDPEGQPYRSWKWGSTDATGYVNQAAFNQVSLTAAQDVYKGDGVIVAVLDTGIDMAHPAFSGKLVGADSMRDMISDDTLPQDGPEIGQPAGVAQGHGTHISGIISHIAPNAKLMPIRVLDPNGRGNTFVLAYAIDWAVEHGADVINLSLGTDFESTVLSNSISSAIARGVVVVAAAGNENVDVPQYPAAYNGVLGVTAVDENMQKATFANYGTNWVDLSAPGVGITSTVPLATGVLYAAWSGTSMATPFASGAAALARQKLPALAVAEIDDLLVSNGDDLDAINPGYGNQLGTQLDISAALVDVDPNDPAPGASPFAIYAGLLFLPDISHE